MPKRARSLERDRPSSISKKRKGATPQASEGCNTPSAEECDTSSRKGETPRARARVLRANGKGFAQRTKPPIVVLDSSEGETPISATHGGDQSRTDVPSPMRSHISDSGTDDSSLHSRNSPRKKSRAEILADKYNPGTPIFDDSDIDIEGRRDNITRSPPETEENGEKSYPIQCLKVEEQSLTLELEGVSKRIEEDKIRVMELTGNLNGISQAIEKLEESSL